MKFENLEITISDKTTGIIYDTVNISEIKTDWKGCDNQTISELALESVENLLKDLINNN